MSYSQAYPLGPLAASDLLALQALQPARYPVLLDSAAASLGGGNYDILLAFPGEHLNVYADGAVDAPSMLAAAGNSFLPLLDAWWRSQRAVTDSALPFHGGWFVYLSYELAMHIEPRLQPTFAAHVSGKQLVARAVRMPAAIVRDCDTNAAWFVAEPQATERLPDVQRDLQTRTPLPGLPHDLVYDLEEDAPGLFIDAVAAALDHIAAGDIYQANLSRGWRAKLASDITAPALYRRLRSANPAPFAGLAWLSPQHAVISSSPERLIQVHNGWAETRPIAGTRPRARDAQIDAALVAELRAHPKERAEHVMLLDLERNDLGRLCVGGSVEVNEYMTIESYAHVHHIVSNVRGRLREQVTPGQAIAAVFPGGTITGCPKLRCMEIIAALECTARGAYTGAMGYLNRDGSMDLNILIRTLELNGRELTFRAGAGIVADSIAERELEETRAKALGLLRAFRA